MHRYYYCYRIQFVAAAIFTAKSTVMLLLQLLSCAYFRTTACIYYHVFPFPGHHENIRITDANTAAATASVAVIANKATVVAVPGLTATVTAAPA